MDPIQGWMCLELPIRAGLSKAWLGFFWREPNPNVIKQISIFINRMKKIYFNSAPFEKKLQFIVPKIIGPRHPVPCDQFTSMGPLIMAQTCMVIGQCVLGKYPSTVYFIDSIDFHA